MTGDVPANYQGASSKRKLLSKVFLNALIIFAVLSLLEWTRLEIVGNGKIDAANLAIDSDTKGKIVEIIDESKFQEHVVFEKSIEGLLEQESAKKYIFGVEGFKFNQDEKNKAFIYNVYHIQIPALRRCFHDEVETVNSNRFQLANCHNSHGFFDHRSEIDSESYLKYLSIAKKLRWLDRLGSSSKNLRGVRVRLAKIITGLPVLEGRHGEKITLGPAEIAAISLVRKEAASEIEKISDSRDWELFESKPDWTSTLWHCFSIAIGPALILTLLQFVNAIGYLESFMSAYFSNPST